MKETFEELPMREEELDRQLCEWDKQRDAELA
jgi:hypothetical protein